VTDSSAANPGVPPARFVALRSALFLLLSWASVLLLVPIGILLSVPFPFAGRYGILSQWARIQLWLLRHVCGLDYHVEGRENIPPGAAIAFSKHQSAWETIGLQDILPAQTWVLKRELMWIPIFGWGLAQLRAIAIDRSAGRKAVQQIVDQGRERLQHGIWIIVFPEGTRVPVGQQRRFGVGGAALAAGTGYPVVPVAHNAGTFWRRREFAKRPGTVQVVIGKPIDPRGKTPEEINRLAAEWMAETMTRLEGKAPVMIVGGGESKKKG
jgi:1-acyl-sn-glycerol-3-phosphate acyltransferase